MAFLATPYSVQVKRRGAPSGEDAHGNPLPPTVTTLTLPVYGIQPGVNDEPGRANRDLSIIVYTILAPKHANLPAEADQVIVDGQEYAVEGRVKDWDRGPFGFEPGVTFELRRAEG